LTSSAQVEPEALVAAGIVQWCTKPVRSSVLYSRLLRLMSDDRPSTPAPQSFPETSAVQQLGRILVVEDNAVNQLVAESMVVKLGYAVDIVANGAEALAAIDAATYSAVLMDCHMPVMDGFEATLQIREAERSGVRRLSIIAMTAGAMDGDRDHCLAAGMDAYISKPVSIAAIDEALIRWTSDPDNDNTPNGSENNPVPRRPPIGAPR
jgi:two-component system sensor histidine kinase/response regulator